MLLLAKARRMLRQAGEIDAMPELAAVAVDMNEEGVPLNQE